MEGKFMKRTELEVGDEIQIKNVFTNYRVQIIRVTKTQAIASTINPIRDGKFELKFRKKVLFDYTPRLINAGKWDNTDYTVLTLDIPKEQLKLVIKDESTTKVK